MRSMLLMLLLPIASCGDSTGPPVPGPMEGAWYVQFDVFGSLQAGWDPYYYPQFHCTGSVPLTLKDADGALSGELSGGLHCTTPDGALTPGGSTIDLGWGGAVTGTRTDGDRLKLDIEGCTYTGFLAGPDSAQGDVDCHGRLGGLYGPWAAIR